MAEMPVDVLLHRFGKLRDSGELNVSDYTAYALDIDAELQEKFQFITQEEIDAAEVEDRGNYWKAGSGPEEVAVSKRANPNWAFNQAVNALRLYQHLTALEAAEKLEQERHANRPEPGGYQLQGPAGHTTFARVTDDRRVLVLQRDGGFVDMTESYDMLGQNPRGWRFTPIEQVEVLF
jgi:hypothetical protein